MRLNLKMKKKNMPPTITEVVQPAGVGTTTVSRVINVAITLKVSTTIFPTAYGGISGGNAF
jgi:hypothetical protein